MKRLLYLPVLLFAAVASAQTPHAVPQSPLTTVPAFPLANAILPYISQQATPNKPFSVLGPRGALLGQQNGVYEAWIFPWKLFSDMRVSVRMEQYSVPIDVNACASHIDVQPNATVITYSHANFTIRQIMLSPKAADGSSGPLVFYQFESVRPMDITFSMQPVMQHMWPSPSDDIPSPEWVADGKDSGFYILHENFPGNAAALAIPGAKPGILAPYQESARYWPLQFVLHYDPTKDAGKLFPLLMAFGATPKEATRDALTTSLHKLDANAASAYAENTHYYQQLLDTHTSLDTPDERLNEAFTWAIAAVDQLKVKTTPDLSEEAFTAGFVGSGNAARPGFGWFFGRDSLWTLYAVNSYGDYTATRKEIDFLLHRQSPEGKIMHEWPQAVDPAMWKNSPYEYAEADATQLLQMAMSDYLRVSGDADYIKANWDKLVLAWRYQTSHVSADGIYNNKQGTGWVESWIPTMPEQEIYLAMLDAESSEAFARLAHAMGHEDLAAEAKARVEKIRGTIEAEYYLPKSDSYAFDRRADGGVDETATIFPAVGWWDGTAVPQHADGMLSRWASSEFSTDWGSRILSDKTSFYDPISYHQGSVWPLFTGWLSMAEYHAGKSLAGYASLMQNANLTWAQDPGAVTELLSGQFYQVLGRSTAHQLWSSAMVISPTLRGLFGIEWNQPEHTLTVTPHLPADWNQATVRRLAFGSSPVDLHFERQGQALLVTASDKTVHLASNATGATVEGGALRIPLPAVEAYVPQHLPQEGATTAQLKVIGEQYDGNQLTLKLEAVAGSSQVVYLHENATNLSLHVDGATDTDMQNGTHKLTVSFPTTTTTVHVRW